MIKTKTAQTTNARKGLAAIVFFKINTIIFNYDADQIKVMVQTYTDEREEGAEEALYVPFDSPITVDFTIAEFLTLFGTNTLNDFDANKYAMLIGEIDKANKGEGNYENKVWDLTAADLETV